VTRKRKSGSIRYELAPDIQMRFEEIVRTLGLTHIDLGNVVCLRSFGSSSRRVVARCHGMSKVLQIAMGIRAFYVLEFISERFDGLSPDDQDETIIHELMHIPNNFGGGFRHHDRVTAENVRKMLKKFQAAGIGKVGT